MINKNITNCEICNKELDSHRAYSRVCSRKCLKENIRKIRIAKHNTICNCDVCGKQFHKTNKVHLRCSKECTSVYLKSKKIKAKENEFNVFKRDKFKCIYCGKSSIEDGVKLHAEHIIPYSKGGPRTIDNIITACEPCNLSKADCILDSEIINRIVSVLNERNNDLTKEQSESIRLEMVKLFNARNLMPFKIHEY